MREVSPNIFKAYDIRGLFEKDIDGDVAELIGRAFAHVLADLSGKKVTALSVALGRDMRLSAPELAARYRDGLVHEGVSVLNAGQVGTEMLYWLVGSRDLDGGLMCTASHNPKAYTGAKLVRKGALALSGDEGIQDIRRLIESGIPDRLGGGDCESVHIYEEFQEAALRFIDPAAIKPLRVVVDGGNGMAGPMVGPLLERLGLDLVTSYWRPDGNFPDHEPNPLLPENREFIIRRVIDEESRRRHRLGRRRGPLLLHRRHRPLRRRRLPDRAAGRVAAEEGAGRDRPLRRARQPRRPRRRAREPRHRADEPRRPRLLQDAHARDGRDLRRRGLGPLLLPGLLLRRLGHDPGAAGAWSCCRRAAEDCRSCSEPLQSEILHLGRDQLDGRQRRGDHESDRGRYSDARIQHLDGLSVDYDDWHFNVRASNTEPLLRLNLESLVSEADMERRRDEVLALIRG